MIRILTVFPPRFLVLMIAMAVLTGCAGAEIVGANETNVWIKNSALNIGDTAELAQKHCSIYGKTAELESDLSIAEGANSITVYTCK